MARNWVPNITDITNYRLKGPYDFDNPYFPPEDENVIIQSSMWQIELSKLIFDFTGGYRVHPGSWQVHQTNCSRIFE